MLHLTFTDLKTNTQAQPDQDLQTQSVPLLSTKGTTITKKGTFLVAASMMVYCSLVIRTLKTFKIPNAMTINPIAAAKKYNILTLWWQYDKRQTLAASRIPPLGSVNSYRDIQSDLHP